VPGRHHVDVSCTFSSCSNSHSTCVLLLLTCSPTIRSMCEDFIHTVPHAIDGRSSFRPCAQRIELTDEVESKCISCAAVRGTSPIDPYIDSARRRIGLRPREPDCSVGGSVSDPAREGCVRRVTEIALSNNSNLTVSPERSGGPLEFPFSMRFSDSLRPKKSILQVSRHARLVRQIIWKSATCCISKVIRIVFLSA
jgi:hypothetical protein